VLAVGTVALTHLLVLGAPFAVAVLVSDDMGLPAVARGEIAPALLWFALGFALYVFLYAACGALVQKVTEVGAAVMPIVSVMVAAYLLSIMVVMENPGDLASVLVSMFPLSAPIGMPIRWAGTKVPIWQLVISMALAAASAVPLARLASRIYRRALLITDRRVRLHDVVRSQAAVR